MFDEAFPILSTPDLDRAPGFYRDLLGGVVAYQFAANRPTSPGASGSPSSPTRTATP